MAILIKEIFLDFYERNFVAVQAKQGDVGRGLLVNLIDNGTTYEIPSGATARIASGTVWNACEITENKISAPITSDMLKTPGRRPVQIELILGNDKLTTVSFTLDVLASARDDGAIEGSNEFSVLDQTIKDAGAATTAANNIANTVQDKLNNGEFDGSDGAGLNLLSDSNVPITSTLYNFAKLYTTEKIEADTEYTIVLNGNFENSGTDTKIWVYVGDAYNILIQMKFTSGADGTLIGTFKTPIAFIHEDVDFTLIKFYNAPDASHVTSTLNWAALYRGKIVDPPNQWTPSRVELKGDPGTNGNDSGIGLNLLAGSNVPVTSTEYNFANLYATEEIEKNTDYTIVLSGNFTNTGSNPEVWVYVGDGFNPIVHVSFVTGQDDLIIGTFRTPLNWNHPDVNFKYIMMYNGPSGSVGSSTMNWAALYRGKIENPPRQWTASVEDINAVSAGKLKNAYRIDGIAFDGSRSIGHYVICNTAAETAAKTVDISESFALSDHRSKIVVKFTYGNSAANPTLNVNSTGAEPIFYKGVAVPANYIKPYTILELQYVGAAWQIVGELAQAQIDALQAELDTLNGSLTNSIDDFNSKLDNKSNSNHTHTLSSDTVTGTLPVSKGGTGKTSLKYTTGTISAASGVTSSNPILVKSAFGLVTGYSECKKSSTITRWTATPLITLSIKPSYTVMVLFYIAADNGYISRGWVGDDGIVNIYSNVEIPSNTSIYPYINFIINP